MDQLSFLGYMAVRKEATAGTLAGIPNIFFPIYSESLATDAAYVEDMPIMAQKFFRYQVLRGNRSHGGGFVASGDSNTAAYLLDMLYTKGTTTGSGPYTHPYTLSRSANPKFYSLEIGLPNMAVRFLGFGASNVTPEFEDGKAQMNVSGSALKAFDVRRVTGVTGSGPYVITLATDYSKKPTEGLFTGDAIQVYDVSAATYLPATVSSFTDTTITVSQNVSAGVDGDILTLAPQTPSWNLGEPLLWGNTEFRFADTASAALSAAHTPLESDTKVALIHEFANADDNHASGSFDPVRLLRGRGDVEFTDKRYFDTPEQMQRFNAISKRSAVVRMFGTGSHELRVTMNNLKAKTPPRPPLDGQEVLYSETEWLPTNDLTDGQAFDVKVINGLATV